MEYSWFSTRLWCSRTWTMLVLAMAPSTVNGFYGVVEGDTLASIFVNGIYLPPDLSLPVLPMNTVRRVQADRATIQAVRPSNEFEPGDVIAMQVYSSRPNVTNITNVKGEVFPYRTFPAGIAAFADGTMTSEEWRCTTRLFDNWVTKDFDDTDKTIWQNAVVQDLADYPWRDTLQYWSKLHAKWISPASILNSSLFEYQVKQFYCRYKIPANFSRLPVEQVQGMSEQAPPLTISRVSTGKSIVQVFFNLSEVANVSCGSIDSRYILRPPTPKELLDWGVMETVEPFDKRWFTLRERSDRGYGKANPLGGTTNGFLTVPNLEQCKVACERYPTGDCRAITWYHVGFEETTGHNCKLMRKAPTEAQLDPEPKSNQIMSTLIWETTSVTHEITIPGAEESGKTTSLVPGTVYTTYCVTQSCRTAGNGCINSMWATVGDSAITERTQDCIDCGEREPPEVYMLGGFANENLNVVVSSDRSGRIFCQAYSNLDAAIDPSDIVDAGFVNLLTLAGGSTQVTITGLEPDQQYALYCLAESDGGIISSLDKILQTKRLMYTEDDHITIASMSISARIKDGKMTVEAGARLTIMGYIWCQVFPSMYVVEKGVDRAEIYVENAVTRGLQMGERQKIEDARASAGILFREDFRDNVLQTNETYEVYCTAMYNTFENESVPGSEAESPYPLVNILRADVVLDSMRLQVLVQRGPARVTCKAVPWQRRPIALKPETPKPEFFEEVPYVRHDLEGEDGATMLFNIRFLATGSWYDAFCYSEEVVYTPPGAVPPPKKGMTLEAIEDTRRTFLTAGPSYEDRGWHCVAGRPCSVADVKGQDLSYKDQVLARVDRCPGTCMCNGVEDQWHKGAECSSVYQGPTVAQPPPGDEVNVEVIDKMEPRGPWCYVDPGTCDDETISNYTPILVSWTACSYNLTAGRPGSGPRGFARGGIGLTSPNPLDKDSVWTWGDAFYWDPDPLIADGRAYSLCWCNGTSSNCEREVDFRLSIGLLHVSGPGPSQVISEMTCIAGTPCDVDHFEGHALFSNSRLAVLPMTDMGCEWKKASQFAYDGVEGFPLKGISKVATDDGTKYSWGGSPVLSYGGKYLLCWCGSVPMDDTAHRRRTNGRDVLASAAAYTCSPQRPDGGAGYLMPAGTLGVVGPYQFNGACGIGVECKLTGVPGYQLQAGDLMAVLKTCGDPAMPPPGWWAGGEGANSGAPQGWQKGGWLKWGLPLTNESLIDMGAPTAWMQAAFQAKRNAPRGVWGFPNRGLSAGPSDGIETTEPGSFRWGAPTWAFSGSYTLCWCAASRGEPCFEPAHFRVKVGTLSVDGPAVLPAAAQIHVCLRGKRCEIPILESGDPPSILVASKIFIADGLCGGPAPIGAPRYGFSLPTLDGKFFTWGDEPTTVSPRQYRICYCGNVGFCDSPEAFGAFAAVLAVKGVTSPNLFIFCPLHVPCMFGNITGEGLHVGDNAKVMTVCGSSLSPSSFNASGFALATYNYGTRENPLITFKLPGSTKGGEFQVCFCPAEALCIRGEDFFISIGKIFVGGPDLSMTYLCYEWRPCTITLVGRNLQDGDRLLVAPPGTNCVTESSPETIEGWPLDGFTKRATNNGRTYTWGNDVKMENYVLAKPGIYDLCWCSSNITGYCGPTGPYNVPAGSIRIAPYREYQFLVREPDPEPRDNDTYYAFLLAAPLPLLFCLAILAGWKRLTSRTSAAEPEAPPLIKRKKAWAAAAQEKAQNMFAITQVMETRIGVKEQLANKSSRVDKPIPSFLKTTNVREPAWARAKREREAKEEAERLALENGALPTEPEQKALPPPPDRPDSPLAIEDSLPPPPPSDMYALQALEDAERHRELALVDAAKLIKFKKEARKMKPPVLDFQQFRSRDLVVAHPRFNTDPVSPPRHPHAVTDEGAGVGYLTDEDSVNFEIRTASGGSGGSIQDRLDL